MKETFVWAISLSHMLRGTRVSTIDLGFLYASLILEKRRKEGQVKVTKGHPQAPKVRERNLKVKGRIIS